MPVADRMTPPRCPAPGCRGSHPAAAHCRISVRVGRLAPVVTCRSPGRFTPDGKKEANSSRCSHRARRRDECCARVRVPHRRHRHLGPPAFPRHPPTNTPQRFPAAAGRRPLGAPRPSIRSSRPLGSSRRESVRFGRWQAPLQRSRVLLHLTFTQRILSCHKPQREWGGGLRWPTKASRWK